MLYTGNGSTQSIPGVGFQPDWTWIKNRSAADAHALTDSVRGVTKELPSNAASAESTNADGLTAFGADGFSLGDDDIYNTNTESYVSWNWKAGGSASSNSDGGTTSSVSANTDAGFSILTYTADAATGTVGHGLNSAPELILGRPRSDTNWFVMETNVLSANQVLNLDGSAAAYNPGVNHYNDTFPTSTVVSYGGYMGTELTNNDKLMYCFHSVEGYSKVGSYTGNFNAQGPFIYTGFRPAWLMLKRTDSADSWLMRDNKRDTFNVTAQMINANETGAEYTDSTLIDFVSNGFKLRHQNSLMNASGGTFIYLAFAEMPLKFANAR